MLIDYNKIYLATELGTLVKVLGPTTRRVGVPMLEVQCVDGAYAGQCVDVPARSLAEVSAEETALAFA